MSQMLANGVNGADRTNGTNGADGTIERIDLGKVGAKKKLPMKVALE